MPLVPEGPKAPSFEEIIERDKALLDRPLKLDVAQDTPGERVERGRRLVERLISLDESGALVPPYDEKNFAHILREIEQAED